MNLSTEKFRRNTMEQKGNGNSTTIKDDSGTKLSEDESDGEDTILNKSCVKETSFQFENVRFSPKIIEFIDAFEGKQFTVDLKIQNIGKRPVAVKIGEPSSFIFQMKKPSRRVKLLVPGTNITQTINYTYHNDDLVQRSQIPVQINGKLIDYPIVVKKAAPDIEVQPTKLDFQVLNLGASAKTMTLTIFNSGGKRTKFEIDVGKNDLDLVVSPIRGTIRAKSQVDVTVEMMGLAEGEYYKELWVTTSEMSIRVPVLVEVVRPRLEIVHPNGTEEFTLIDFKPTFNGTQRVETFVLKNYSAESTLFITVAEINGELQFLNQARSTHPAFKMFTLTSEEGRLDPFECRILTVLYEGFNFLFVHNKKGTNRKTTKSSEIFKAASIVGIERREASIDVLQKLLQPLLFPLLFQPKVVPKKKGWHTEEDVHRKNWEHMVFFRINRVHCIEREELVKVEATPLPATAQESRGSLMQSKVSSSNPEHPRGKIRHPSNDIFKVLDSGFLPKANRTPLDGLSVDEKVLRLCLHGRAVDPKVLIQPTCFDLGEVGLEKTEDRVLRLKNISSIQMKYKFVKTLNINISPNEGWLQPEETEEFLVRLHPTCAGKFKSKIKIDILAKSDVVLSTDKNLKTVAIYTVPISYNVNSVTSMLVPKLGLGITPLVVDNVGFHKELVTFKNNFKAPYAAVLLSQRKNMRSEWMKNEPDKVTNVDNAMIALPNDRPRLYYAWPEDKICRTIFKGFFRYSPPKDTDYTLSPESEAFKKENRDRWNTYIRLLKEIRLLNQAELDKLKDMIDYDGSMGKQYKPSLELESDTSESLKKKDDAPRESLVPLSPMHLSNITVEPKFINFKMVAANTLVQETLIIDNMNPFPISIRFIPGKSAVTVVEGNTITILPNQSKRLQVSFQIKDLGRYYGFLNYVINGSHEFKITISAFVTSKTLVLDREDLTVEFGNYPLMHPFQPETMFVALKNLLQSPIKYWWALPQDCAFNFEIIEGEIPSRSRLLTEISLKLGPTKPFYSESSLVSESGNKEMLKLIYINKKVSVNFLTNRINMHDVPLNLSAKAKPVIQNHCYHEVVFQVMNPNPMPGVYVEPKQGVIKPRSFFPLDVKVQIPVIMKFAFEVVLHVHLEKKISVKIRIRPSELVMRKICAQSFDTVTVCLDNVGTTPAEIAVDFKGCPEYKVADGRNKIYLPANKSSSLAIRFDPKDVARYVFYLPVIINKILGPPVMQEPVTEYVSSYIANLEHYYQSYGNVLDSTTANLKLPCVCINCTITQSLLQISCLNVNFRLKPNSHSEFQPQCIVLSNEFMDEVTFCLRNDDLGENNDSPFDLIPVNPKDVEYRTKSIKAKLKQGEKLYLEGKFSPKVPGSYTVNVPIFVKGYSEGKVYNYITLTGTIKKPTLIPDYSEIHFPPLPINVGCDTILAIIAENYHSTDTISCIIWDENDEGESPFDFLTVSWLTEPNIIVSSGPQIFKIRVTFQSPLPAALRNYLVFLDSKGEYCTVLVTATSDNSAVTTHAFLKTRPNKYKVIRDFPPKPYEWHSEEKSLSSYPVDKLERKRQSPRMLKCRKSETECLANNTINTFTTQNSCLVDKGPKLVIQATKSMSRPSQLGFVSLTKNQTRRQTLCSSSTMLSYDKEHLTNSVVSQSESLTEGRSSLIGPPFKRPEPAHDVTHPNFPSHDGTYGKHFQETLIYVERWMFEVGMRCDQYFVLPTSFQKLRDPEKHSKKSLKNKSNKERVEKDFLDFLQEIVKTDMKIFLPQRMYMNKKNRSVEVERLHKFFTEILEFFKNEGRFLPHVRPEFLFDYDDYALFQESRENLEKFEWRNPVLKKINSAKMLHSDAAPVNPMKPKSKMESISQISSLFSPASKESWRKTFFGHESVVEVNESEDWISEKVENPQLSEQIEAVQKLVDGKKFIHRSDNLDKVTFEARSKQAWLDIVIQIFRHFVLKKIVFKNTVPQIRIFEVDEKLPVQSVGLHTISTYTEENSCCTSFPCLESLDSNLYTVQERILLMWLNHHYQSQKKILWPNDKDLECASSTREINNFDQDLADSVALIAVTCAHCPYIVKEFFSDIFQKPDTLNKMYHNAGKLVLAWRTLYIGLTVKTADIVKPNPVFMIMLVAQLYDVLPSLHPQSLICFSTSLTSEITRTIQLRNDSQDRIFYQPKFLGDWEGLFRLKETSLIEAKPSKITDINIVFTARKAKKVSATLILSGCVISPNFSRHLAFYLEGEPSDLSISEKFAIAVPLYKVICAEIPIKSPYSEPATYEVWFTTKEPVYKDCVDVSAIVKPWSKIWNRKVSRRLFLNQNEVTIEEGKKSTTLSVSIGCFTEEPRFFWLMFRNPKIGDFLILVHIKTKTKASQIPISEIFSDNWSESAQCICNDGKNDFRSIVPNCPLLTMLRIPRRNDPLWDCLWSMFVKTLHPQEKTFWVEHFETNIGLCLILWLLNTEEEEAVIDEFIHFLSTKVVYNIKVQAPVNKYVTLPKKVEVTDVREGSFISIPVHVSKNLTSEFEMDLIMSSENGKEIRNYKVSFLPPDPSTVELGLGSNEGYVGRPVCDTNPSDVCTPCIGNRKNRIPSGHYF